jgi:hypothetical protein
MNADLSSDLLYRILLAHVQTILRGISPKQKPPMRAMHLVLDTPTKLRVLILFLRQAVTKETFTAARMQSYWTISHFLHIKPNTRYLFAESNFTRGCAR